MNRWVRVTSAVLVSVALASCAQVGGEAHSAAPSISAMPTARFDASTPPELRVREPKDARGIPVCELLTRDQLLELGLDPATAQPDSFLRGETCSWRFADGSTRAGVGLSVDPAAQKLPDFYRLRNTSTNFQILDIAGHPAVRSDDRPVGDCSLYVAVSDLQILSTNGYADGRALPDPCAPARRMAELVLSNLSPLP
jgi:hypothetical protein